MNRRRRRIKAVELFDAETRTISLVDRGAIRTPFRKFKSEDSEEEDDMGIDLTRVAESAKPLKVVALVGAPGLDREKLAEALKGHGFSTESLVEYDGCPVFTQEPDLKLTGREHKLKLNDQLCVLLSGTWPKPKEKSKGVFSERIGANAFVPGIQAACETLAMTLAEHIYGELSPGAGSDGLTDKAEEALSEFAEFVMNLVKRVPRAALSASKLAIPVETAKAEEPGKVEKTEAELAAEAEAKKVTEKSDHESLLASMKGLLDEHVKTIDTKLDALRGEVEKTKSDLKRKLSSHLSGYSDDSDPEEREKEDRWAGGGFDTGMEFMSKR